MVRAAALAVLTLIGCMIAGCIGIDPCIDEPPSWSPDGTRIAFGRNHDDNTDVYVISANGTGLVRLTSDPASDSQPSWSPDGDRIAFASDRDGDLEIYVMDVDGSDVTRLTDNEAGDGQPAWSPDGTKIAFVSDSEEPENRDIYVMNADGSGRTRLTTLPSEDWFPAWAPDGARIAFSRWDAADEGEEETADAPIDVYVMNADGSGQTLLLETSLLAAWSPDGSKIAFVSEADDDENWDIYVVSANGGDPIRLTDSPHYDLAPAWAPDGSKIAFRRSPHEGDEEEDDAHEETDDACGLFVMNADGSGHTRIAELCDPD
jgi:Tol biopolymer transport system component